MDPFDILYNSTTPLIVQLESTSPQSLDFLTLQNEIVQSIDDLNESVSVVENNLLNNDTSNPFSDISIEEISHRKEKVNQLNNQLNDILIKKNVSNLKGNYGNNPFLDSNNISISTNTFNPNKQTNDNNQNGLDSSTREYHQQLLQQQDDIISNELTTSINNLHQQALSIGDELDFQSDLLNQVDDNMERLNFKIVNNGMKKINKFLETNEMGGNCCIAILVVVLVVILVLLIIV